VERRNEEIIMPYMELTIDSLRHAMHKDQWVVVLEDKANHKYLPIYVDKVWADIIAKALRNEACDDVIDADIEPGSSKFRIQAARWHC